LAQAASRSRFPVPATCDAAGLQRRWSSPEANSLSTSRRRSGSLPSGTIGPPIATTRNGPAFTIGAQAASSAMQQASLTSPSISMAMTLEALLLEKLTSSRLRK
jgi:hypothetical protein